MMSKQITALTILAASLNFFNLPAIAHTAGAGAVWNSDGNFTIWYGTYTHGSNNNYKQGSVTVTSGGSSSTQAVDLLQTTVPNGIDPNINFYSNQENVNFGGDFLPLVLFQGTTFSSIQPGTVQFEFTDCTQGVDCPAYPLNWIGGGALDNMQFTLSNTGVSSFSTLVSGGSLYDFANIVSDDGDASYSISGDRYVGKALSASLDSNGHDGIG